MIEVVPGRFADWVVKKDGCVVAVVRVGPDGGFVGRNGGRRFETLDELVAAIVESLEASE